MIFFICAFVFLLLILSFVFWLSSLLLYPPRQLLTRNPSNYGLDYEEVSFESTDHLALKGWLIPCSASAPVVILLHPQFGNRHGVDAHRKPWPGSFQTEVDLLKVAQAFHQAGWAVLMFDFRSHGESQRGLCGGGMTEDQDVTGAVDYTFNRLVASLPEGETPRVGVVGFGLGASAILAAVGRMKGKGEKLMVFTGDSEGGAGWTEIQPPNIKRLSFAILVQPVSLGSLLRGWLEDIMPALSILIPFVDRLCQARGGYPLDGNLLLKAVREVYLPVLIIQIRLDHWSASSELQDLYEVLPGPKRIEWIEAPSGRLEVFRYLVDHPQALLDFAAQFMLK